MLTLSPLPTSWHLYNAESRNQWATSSTSCTVKSEIKFCQLLGVHNRACGGTMCCGGGGAGKNAMQLQIWLTTWIAWTLASSLQC